MPLSQNRWRAIHLDEPEQFPSASQHLAAVIAAFGYLNDPEQAANLRITFNIISEHLEDFDGALNSLRVTKGLEPLSVTSLWEEFIRIHYQVVTNRAHAWVLSHISPLRQAIVNDLLAYLPPSDDSLSSEQWVLINKLHDLTELAARADYTILIPMDGYKGYSAPAPREAAADLMSADLQTRRRAYSEALKVRS